MMFKELLKKSKILAALALIAITGATQAATISQTYNGAVTICPVGLCSFLGAANGVLTITFDVEVLAAGTITDTAAISNVGIEILKTDGGILGFTAGSAQSANFAVNAGGNILSGEMVLRATGATTFVTLDALINVGPGSVSAISPDHPTGSVLAGEWSSSLPDLVNIPANAPGFVAAGSGTFAPVPVPAAVWLFGSALGLLGWMRRRVNC